MTRRFLTAKEVAELLRTSPGHLANQRMRGEGTPYLKLARRVLYDKQDVDAWLERHRVRTVDRST